MIKQLKFIVLGLTLILGLIISTPAQAERKGQASDSEFSPSGIRIDNDSIKPGDPMTMVFGLVGPPDAVHAMRSKSKKVEDDFVRFTYYDRFIVHINKDNIIQSINVESHNTPFVGVPFKIGDSKQKVIAAWKEPDRSVDNMIIYWHRGVYVILDKENKNKVERIFFTLPGRLEENNKSKAPTKNS